MIDALQYLSKAMTFLSVSAFFALLAGAVLLGTVMLIDDWRETLGLAAGYVAAVGAMLLLTFAVLWPVLIH